MKINQIPKQEDVIEVGVGAQKLLVVSATNENRNYLAEAVFSTYLGEQCKYCGKKYKTLEDLKDTVWAGDHKHGRLACRACWSANNEEVDDSTSNETIGSTWAALTDWVRR